MAKEPIRIDESEPATAPVPGSAARNMAAILKSRASLANAGALIEAVGNINRNPATAAMQQIREAAKEREASGICEQLARAFTEIQASLNPEKEEIGIASFVGNVAAMYVDAIGYRGPVLIEFICQDSNGSRVHLIQHINQLSFQCVVLKRQPERDRVGFFTPQDLEAEQ